jgi:hypothetical protein
MATLARHHIHIDEVQHVIGFRDCSRKTTSVVPRNVYRRSLVRPHLLPSKASLLQSRKRPARTPPSTFLFLPIHLSNSPETMAVPLPDSPGSRRSPNLPTEIGRLVTLSVRSFAGAPSRLKAGRRAVVEALYGRPLHLVNTKSRQNSSQVSAVERSGLAVPLTPFQGRRAALAPHSSRVVRIGERPVITARITRNLAAR